MAAVPGPVDNHRSQKRLNANLHAHRRAPEHAENARDATC